MFGVKVPAGQAQAVKKALKEKGVLDKTRKVKRDEGFIIFPVTEEVKGLEIVEAEFDSFKGHKNWRDVLGEKLKPEELEMAKRAFDVIGDIAIIEVPDELEAKEKAIAEALLEAHKNIRGVYKKSGDISGTQRTRALEFLAGEDMTKTTHKEHGMALKLDIKKAYFSPRLSAERERILAQVKDGETIVDLFAGIGPFSILLAKNRDVKVYAIDVNEGAFNYLKENVRINRVGDRVVPLLGDCRKAAPKGVATRVIMNLPKSSHEFLDVAFDALKEGVIHYYAISHKDDLYDSKIEFIKKTAKEKGKKVETLGRKIVRPYSPYNYHVVIDVGVK